MYAQDPLGKCNCARLEERALRKVVSTPKKRYAIHVSCGYDPEQVLSNVIISVPTAVNDGMGSPLTIVSVGATARAPSDLLF